MRSVNGFPCLVVEQQRYQPELIKLGLRCIDGQVLFSSQSSWVSRWR
jgi:hypothetical protein